MINRSEEVYFLFFSLFTGILGGVALAANEGWVQFLFLAFALVTALIAFSCYQRMSDEDVKDAKESGT